MLPGPRLPKPVGTGPCVPKQRCRTSSVSLAHGRAQGVGLGFVQAGADMLRVSL